MKPMAQHRIKSTSRSGYGLVVIAAIFTAFAVIAAAALDRNNALSALDQQMQAKHQMQRLSYALLRYARDHSSKFPCPADRTLAYSDVLYGTQSSTTCYTGAVPSGNTLIGAGNFGVTGLVPVRELLPYGISIADSIDPWGNRIAYAVDRPLTVGGSGVVTNRFTITDTITATSYGDADFVLVSAGRNHIGAYVRNGTFTACSGGFPTDSENCDTDSLFYSGPALTHAAAAGADYFDDILSWGRL